MTDTRISARSNTHTNPLDPCDVAPDDCATGAATAESVDVIDDVVDTGSVPIVVLEDEPEDEGCLVPAAFAPGPVELPDASDDDVTDDSDDGVDVAEGTV